MKQLLEINDRHPGAVTLIGSASGVASWLFDHLASITSIASCIGAVGTAALVVLAVSVKIYATVRDSFRCAVRNRRAKTFRRRLYEQPPLDPDDDLDFTDYEDRD